MAQTKHSNETVLARFLEIRPHYTSDAAAHEALRVEFGYANAASVRGKLLRARRLGAERARAEAGQSGERLDVPLAPIPEGQVADRYSTLYDADGKMVMQWVKTRAEQQTWQQIISAVLESIPKLIAPRKPVLRVVSQSNDLLALYPLADLHVGLYASLMDGGANWRLQDTVALVKACIDDLIARTPKAARAVVANLGDMTHVDNMTNRTPNSGAPLDADGRFIEIARAVMEVIVYVIDRVAQHHSQTEVYYESGNHDEATALVIQSALALLYRDDARVTVHVSGKRTACLQHGQVALGFTHGDTIKAKDLPLIMANDYPEIWAATRFRVFHTGHIHHKTVQEFTGCIVESHQSPAPRDAWHERSGYRSLHSMCSVVYDHAGEYARQTIQIRHGEQAQAEQPAIAAAA